MEKLLSGTKREKEKKEVKDDFGESDLREYCWNETGIADSDT